jgi:hypothetical protein
LWTFREPVFVPKIEAKVAGRNTAMLRKRTHVNFDASRDANGPHHDSRARSSNGIDGETTEDAAH